MPGQRLFERTSRECDLIRMTPELADAVKAWADREERTPLLAEVRAGCETTSTSGRRGPLARMAGAPRRQLCGMLLTPEWLIWVTKPDDDSPFVVGVRLAESEVKDYREEPDHQIVPDHGVRVFGFIGYASERGSIFLGLGEDPDGRAFKEKLLAAWRAARD